MSRSILVGAAAIAAAALLPTVPAIAQDDTTIIVGVPHVSGAEQPRNSVHQSRQFVAQISVPTDDLDLRTEHGRYTLDRRVREAANDVCRRLDELAPAASLSGGPTSESLNCRQQAIRTAQAQVRAAPWSAG